MGLSSQVTAIVTAPSLHSHISPDRVNSPPVVLRTQLGRPIVSQTSNQSAKGGTGTRKARHGMRTNLTILSDLEHAARRILGNPDGFGESDSLAYDLAGQALLQGYDGGVYFLPDELHAAGDRLIAGLCESQGVHHTELMAWRRTPYRLTGLFPPALRKRMPTALELALDQATRPDDPGVGLQYTEWGVCRPDDGKEILLAMIWLEQGFRVGGVSVDIPDVSLAAVPA